MLTTYGFHTPPRMQDTVEVDGVTYRRIERLPRNLKPGDLLLIGDNTDKAAYHQAFVTVTDVQSWPQSFRGYTRYAPQVVVSFRLRPQDNTWRWRSWGNQSKFHDSETRERVTWAYRAVKPA